MRLFEHPDFDQAVIRAAEHFRPRGLREAIIEKDYFVTEALRIITSSRRPCASSSMRQAPRSSSRAAPACRRAGV
ncbi:MAG: hypothetical protein ABSE84_34010 [Isosphaeraceae bacterium]